MIYLSINICLSMAFVPLRVTITGKSRHCCAFASCCWDLVRQAAALSSQPGQQLHHLVLTIVLVGAS
jgi:hypothetical protein